MLVIGIVVAWFGYSVFYYGLDTVKGGNDSFVSLIWPGKYSPQPRDSGGSGSSSTSGGTGPQSFTAPTGPQGLLGPQGLAGAPGPQSSPGTVPGFTPPRA